MISVIDYGAGNLASISSILTSLGYSFTIVSSKDAVPRTTTIVLLPGVGDGSFMMEKLEERGFAVWLHTWMQNDNPVLGICVGAQVLLSFTEEGNNECLHAIEGRCARLSSAIQEQCGNTHGVKIPHIGWNEVKQVTYHPIFKDIPNTANFYFVHSYYLSPEDTAHIFATTEYGITFASIIGKGNIWGTQFHPEKSGKWGRQLMDNFLTYYST